MAVNLAEARERENLCGGGEGQRGRAEGQRAEGQPPEQLPVGMFACCALLCCSCCVPQPVSKAGAGQHSRARQGKSGTPRDAAEIAASSQHSSQPAASLAGVGCLFGCLCPCRICSAGPPNRRFQRKAPLGSDLLRLGMTHSGQGGQGRRTWDGTGNGTHTLRLLR